MKKKVLSLALALALVLGSFGIQAKAADTKVNVTIANGTIVLANYTVTVTDADADGALTINDALYLAHEAKFEGGAAAGYGSAVGTYGLSLTKLWGVENGGSYGYTVNNVFAMGLADVVKDGDSIVAYVYQDTTAYSDQYAYFDKTSVSAKVGDDVVLTLSGLGYDASWNTVVLPVANATILIDGKESAYKTDANGKVTISATKVENVTISAKGADGSIIVPPLCTLSVAAAAAPATGDSSAVVFAGAFAGLLAVVFVATRRKNAYEA